MIPGRRPVPTWMTRVVAVVFMLTVMILVARVINRSVVGGEETTADPVTGGVVTVAMLDIPVSSAVPGFEDVAASVWYGRPAPQPQFDTTAFGQDWTFVAGTILEGVVDGLAGDVVYLGDTLMLVYAEAAPVRNPWDWLYRFVTGHAERRILNGPFGIEVAGGDPPHLPSVSWGNDAELPVVFSWLSVPDDVSIVAFEVNGEPAGFQRPVGRIAAVQFTSRRPVDITVTAYDPTGRSVFGPLTIEDPVTS